MNEDPDLYSKSCQMQKFDTNHFLDTYFKRLNVKSNATVLDLGAGDASVTLEALLPRLPNFHKLVVSDKSKKMINFAKNRFHDERIEVIQMDILDYDKAFKDHFDHIFTFHCLNLIPEARTPDAMRNIFEILKPGGNFFATIIVDASLYEFCDSMINDKIWPPAMANYKNFFSPYRGCDNPAEKLTCFLKNAGFDVQFCKYEERKFTYEYLNQFADYALSIFPVLKIESRDERAKFAEDVKKTIRKHQLATSDESTRSDDKVHYFYSVLVACASKPV